MVNGKYVLDDSTDDGYYHYGNGVTAVKYLLNKVNGKNIDSYTEGNINELYTF